MICHWKSFEQYEIQDILKDQLMLMINTVPFKLFDLLKRDKDKHFGDCIYKCYEPQEVLNGYTVLNLLINRPQNIL